MPPAAQFTYDNLCRKSSEIGPGRDAAFYVAHRGELSARYGGRLVAIRDEEVVADAETYFQLHKILCARFGGLAYAYIKKVTPQSFEEWGDEPAVIIGFFAARIFLPHILSLQSIFLNLSPQG
jgi:hypothetical protein